MTDPQMPGEGLSQKKCKPCEGGAKPLNPVMVKGYLAQLTGWELVDPSSGPMGPSGRGGEIVKNFRFQNFHETMGFVNAVAWIANREDHHPELEVGYKICKVRYMTHAIRGLSENDFICAAKIDQLLKD
jgi:4a-hydroxytetrahydrobiopterin dehydratase